MSQAYEKGKEACFAGLALNRNPHIGKKGIIAHLQRGAWQRGFKEAEVQAGGA